ncbi:unnamed protein product [Moneuplotes crassus]|uniref:Uncharacterized protein n=1 Tax=Euplotes crassus TaxID=5936 RepID=A0AAD2D9J3_EUPCR|nr:unnamed protein product [Moneuplotes crassus]
MLLLQFFIRILSSVGLKILLCFYIIEWELSQLEFCPLWRNLFNLKFVNLFDRI